MSDQTQVSAATGNGSRRERWRAIVVELFAALGLIYCVYGAVALRHVQSTDDAYARGNVLQITPQIPGTVISVGADDTRFVTAK